MTLDIVIERLTALGYTATDDDQALITIAIDKVTKTIMSDCNVSAVPEGLLSVAYDMVLGEFLQLKKTFAPDTLAMFDLDAAITSIQVGDTSTSFGTGSSTSTDEQRLDALISYLLSHGRDEFSSFRRVRW